MTLWIRRGVVALILLAGVSVYAIQQGGGRGGARGGEEEDVILPNGKSQKDEILKTEHQQNLKDAAELAELGRPTEDRPGKERSLRAFHGDPQENR